MAIRERPKAGGLYASKVGMMLPPSPRAVASLMDLNTEPDHGVADVALVIGWETDPAVTREYVPEPLEVDGSGRIFSMTVSRTAYAGRARREFISAERLTQTESFIKIPCTFEGQRCMFRSFSWGNRDRLVTAGRQVGLFHKFAKIQMTQFDPFHATWNGPHEGARINVTVENIGTVLRAYGELKRAVRTEEELPDGVAGSKDVPNIGHRYIWDSCTRSPARNDLVMDGGGSRETRDMWAGDGWIQFYDAENEEVQQFAPRRMIGAWWYRARYGKGAGGPRVIHDYGATNPYASRPRIRQLLEAEA